MERIQQTEEEKTLNMCPINWQTCHQSRLNPTVCPPNENEVDFRISLDESDDEDYTNIKLIDEVSLSEYDEEIVSRFNDLFNVIHPDDSKSEKDNDDNDIGIMQSSEGDEITHGENGLSETSHDKIIKTFETGSFVINLNIVIGEYYVNGMLFILIINLYVPFGIPFDPKRYYKDGSHTKVIEANGIDPIEDRQDLAVSVEDGISGEGQQDSRRIAAWRHFYLATLRGFHMEQEMAEAGFEPTGLAVIDSDPRQGI
ncbi:hypothetical protein Tco_1210061 [Tanacetum coccineum]